MTGNFRRPEEYITDPALVQKPLELVQTLARQTCRSDFRAAGFSLLRLGAGWESRRLRGLMLEILDGLSVLSKAEEKTPLSALSMSRFDQQSSTKPHRDGGPAESLLLLGYEPTPIESRLFLADYSVCADKMGLTPAEFLTRHNPMFPSGGELLAEYTTHLREFDPHQAQILLINNSMAELGGEGAGWQGVLHQAEIPEPREGVSRVVNSIQIAKTGQSDSTPVTPQERDRFLNDDALGKQYGKAMS